MPLSTLSDLQLRSLPFADGQRQRDYHDASVRGLYIRVGRRTKTFMLTVRDGSHRKRVNLGHYPVLTLAKAREKARDILAQARLKNTEPERITFAEALDLYYRVHGPNQRAVSHQMCRYVLDTHFRPAFRSFGDVTPTAIAHILDPLKPGMRRNAYVYLRAFLNWSYRREYIDSNPALRLNTPKSSVPRDRVLSHEELLTLYLRAFSTDYGHIIRLLILTGQRIGQFSRWKPEYLQGDLITWPASAMKANKAHTIPSTPAMNILIVGRSNLVPWKQPDSKSKARLDKASGVTGWTHHDIRRSVATPRLAWSDSSLINMYHT